MNRKRYVIHDGFVKSRNDGQRHYISQMQVIELYGVSYLDCVPYRTSSHGFIDWKEPEGATHLYPRNDGNYTLPEVPA